MKKTLYLFIMLLLVAGVTNVAWAQINAVPKCKTCGEAIAACPYKGKHPAKCKTCSKTVDKCPYKGKHPKCKLCGKTVDKCPYKGKHPAKCKTCGKTVDKCAYNGKHPTVPSGFDVIINCNVGSDATLYIDGTGYGKLNNPLECSFSDISEYEKETLSISNGIKVEKVFDGVFKAAGIRDGYIITDINNTLVDSRFDVMDIFDQIISNNGDKVMYITGLYASGKKVYFVVDLNSNKLQSSHYLKTGIHSVKLAAEGYEDFFSTISVDQNNNRFYFKMTEKSADALYQEGCAYYNDGKATGDAQFFTKAVTYFRQASEKGHANAQNQLGSCYQNSYGVLQDYYESVKWYRKSAEQGNAFGQSSLGFCYEHGLGVEKDYTEAVKWYRKSADQGNPEAQNRLGECYWSGLGVNLDHSEAVRWFYKAAEQGLAAAQYNMGWCYEHGDGLEQNPSEAVNWYRKAANQGYAWAQSCMGKCYEMGIGVPISRTEAIIWYSKAADQGDEYAKSALKRMEPVNNITRITRTDLNKKTKSL